MQPIIQRIQDKVTGQNNLIAIALNKSIDEGNDGNIIISNIQDMAKDNYVMMRSILGKILLTDIINHK